MLGPTYEMFWESVKLRCAGIERGPYHSSNAADVLYGVLAEDWVHPSHEAGDRTSVRPSLRTEGSTYCCSMQGQEMQRRMGS